MLRQGKPFYLMSKIVLFGHSWITVHLINNLVEKNLKPDLVVTMHSDKSKNISGFYDLTKILNNYNIKCYHPDSYSLKNDKDLRFFKNYDFDFGLVFGWSRLIPENIINQAKKAILGVHGGPFPPPRCRGRAVFNWALIDGFKNFYIYIFKISPGIDDGDIFLTRNFRISSFDNIQSVYDKNSIVSTKMFIQLLLDWEFYRDMGIKQNDEKATYLRGRKSEDSGICWDDSTNNIYNFIRALVKPFPNAFTQLFDQKIYIQSSIPFDDIQFKRFEPGYISCVFSNGNFVVQTGDGFIYINNYDTVNNSKIVSGSVLKSFPKQSEINIY